MINILLVAHAVIGILLVVVIMLQKSSNDSLGGLGGGSNAGLITAKTAADFLTKATIFLATFFIINSLVLGNLSNGKNASKLDKVEIKENKDLPVAK